MRTVLTTAIILSKFRQRKLFAERALVELADSIAAHGLLHPIVCTTVSSGRLRLVAGERRLRAVLQLHADRRAFRCDGEAVPPDHIPYILIADKEPIDLRSAELEENLQREDLTWQERTAAIDELHQLRLEANPEQTTSDTARELESSTGARGGSHTTARRAVARAVILAPHLEDPDVAGAGSAAAAFGIVSRKVEAEFREELERRGKANRTVHTLVVGDLKTELQNLPADTFTCIIADPPYGRGADKFGDVSLLPHHYADTPEHALDVAGWIVEEGLRITKREAHLYIFCDIEMFFQLRDGMPSPWDVWRSPIIWDKGHMGYAPIGVSGLRYSYECILWARKGGKCLSQVYGDVISCPSTRNKIHAAQKPVELYRTLLRRSCLPGDSVLDPCCGSGTIFPAATLASCKATGIENDKEAAKLARTRMEE